MLRRLFDIHFITNSSMVTLKEMAFHYYDRLISITTKSQVNVTFNVDALNTTSFTMTIQRELRRYEALAECNGTQGTKKGGKENERFATQINFWQTEYIRFTGLF